MKQTTTSVSRVALAVRSRQGVLGTAIFSLFLLASVMVSQTVQAVNQAAGNYGYYGGTYGYNTTDPSSDDLPAASGTISAVATNTSLELTWSAPTLTVAGTAIATGSGSIASYNIYYNASSITTCAAGAGGASTTSTSATKTISSLTSGTTYYVVVCAVDNNQNEGSPKTGSFATASAAGSSGGSGGGSAGTSIFSNPTTTTTSTPTGSTTSTTVSSVSVIGNADALVSALGLTRNTAAEATNAAKVSSSVTQFKVTLTAEQKTILTNFVTYGISSATISLGSGERLALVRDQLETLGRLSVTALEQLATGQKPTDRNLAKEQAQVSLALKVFVKLTGHKPNFKVSSEDLAWNTLQYRIRFPRDLNKEKAGIIKFKAVEKRNPTTPFDWAEVRAWGYKLGVK